MDGAARLARPRRCARGERPGRYEGDVAGFIGRALPIVTDGGAAAGLRERAPPRAPARARGRRRGHGRPRRAARRRLTAASMPRAALAAGRLDSAGGSGRRLPGHRGLDAYGAPRACRDADPARRRSHPARLRRGYAAAVAALAGRARRLDVVLFSHYHADHVLGLPGLLKTYDLRGREQGLELYGPSGLSDLLAVFAPIIGRLGFPLARTRARRRRRGARRRLPAARARSRPPRTGGGVGAAARTSGPAQFDVGAARRLGVPEGPAFGELQRGSAVTAATAR